MKERLIFDSQFQRLQSLLSLLCCFWISGKAGHRQRVWWIRTTHLTIAGKQRKGCRIGDVIYPFRI